MRALKIKTGKGRPSWEEIWLKVTDVVSKRSTCLHYKVGAVIVRGSQLLAIGYNGSPRGVQHCTDVGCAKVVKGKKKNHQGLCRGAHAELNAIANAASLGINISGSSLYVTYRPCAICAKTIINSGIKEVFYAKDYKGDEAAWQYFLESGTKIRRIELN